MGKSKYRNILNVEAIPDWDDPLEEGMATHFSILCLENPMDRGAWWTTVYRVEELDYD